MFRPCPRFLSTAVLALVGLHCALPAAAAEPAALHPPATRAWLNQADYLRDWLARDGFELGARVHLRVYKESRELEVHLLRDGRYRHFRSFRICALSGELGPKLREGDLQAPEGVYRVTPAQMNPRSEYHLAFDLGFPNARDRSVGATGSNIMIHGGCASVGCFAITDYYMEQLWVLVEAAFENGQDAVDVQVFPFRMTPDNLARHARSPHRDFWAMLEPLDRYFDDHGFSPRIDLRGGVYRVADTDEGPVAPAAGLTAP
ncbi:murein L,D-transpeptidase [Wenzhouxiangella sp. XN79A]|uniref:murein L,D-transpeptidase n=1 Tax=Wenzhouxiangella sp. XN79A TaxID=2724193 RepID=UPI00144AEE85|nr:murein L,D-transpeptidase [Wenzhouxiangella sp. XN79A]NKI34510.1 murein L,D-transpeptidase [Wenzhouxiangella sp. XN79A]